MLKVRWNRCASLAKDENVLSNDLHLEQAKRTMSTKDNRSNWLVARREDFLLRIVAHAPTRCINRIDELASSRRLSTPRPFFLILYLPPIRRLIWAGFARRQHCPGRLIAYILDCNAVLAMPSNVVAWIDENLHVEGHAQMISKKLGWACLCLFVRLLFRVIHPRPMSLRGSELFCVSDGLPRMCAEDA